MLKLKLAFDTELRVRRAAQLMGYDLGTIELIDRFYCLPLAYDSSGSDSMPLAVSTALRALGVEVRLMEDTAP